MNTEREVLDHIYQTELQKLRPATRSFTLMKLSATHDWVATIVNKPITSKTFRPSIFLKAIIIIVFGGGTFLLIKEAIYNPQDKMDVIIVCLCLIGGFFLFAVYQLFLNKKINFNIKVDDRGIRIGKDHYYWREITATAILTKGYGRYRYQWLVIATGDGSKYQVYSLSLFKSVNGIARELSKYIAYFKR